MAEYTHDDFITSPKEGIKTFSEIQSHIDRVITTPSGVTVIPVSKITMGYVSGGVGLKDNKNEREKGCGGGGGTGIAITPLAFLTVGQSGEINLISLSDTDGRIEKIVDLVEHAPEIIEKIKNAIS